MNCLFILKLCHQRGFSAFVLGVQVINRLTIFIQYIVYIHKKYDRLLFYTVFGIRITANTTPDKIFVASDNKVKAYNRKGKMFLTFTSNLTEPIRSMYIMGNDMILCGNHVYNHYRDCKDIGSYLCGDTIVDVAVLCPNNVSRFDSSDFQRN